MKIYYSRWYTGLELRVGSDDGKVDWPRVEKWRLVDNMLTSYLSLGPYTIAFKFYHPMDWRFYARRSHPTRG